MTIQEAGQALIKAITAIYDENEASNIANLLLEHYTGIGINELMAKKGQVVTDHQLALIDEAQQRLLQHEPLQYIINEAWFFGHKFYVDQNVLIPRPETEELVDWIVSHVKFPVDNLSILDIGTGSGCIPITLKRKIRKADVWSCDISLSALSVAQKNADTLGASINFNQLDFLNTIQTEHLPSFDIIVSNPPYVPEKDKGEMHKNVLNFEPHTALFVPDSDPLKFYKAIASFTTEHLSENGSVFLEMHGDYAMQTRQLFIDAGFKNVEIKKDMQGKDRLLHANRR